jgi:hypothetical protein
LARLSQAAAHDGEKLDGKRGLVRQHREEVPAVEGQQQAFRHGGRIRGSRPTVEESDLAEHLVRPDQVEDDFALPLGVDADLDDPGENGEQAVPFVALLEDRATRWYQNLAGVGRKPLNDIVRKAPEEFVLPQDRKLVARPANVHAAPCA